MLLRTRICLSTLLFGLLSLYGQAEIGVFKDRIVLGQSAALTGPAKLLGTEMRDGANAYFAQINAAGGVNGRKVELISLDDGYEPERTVANTRQLLEQNKVFALFGYVGTPTTLAAKEILSEAKVPLFAPFTGAESLRTPFNRYLFHIRAGYGDETEKIVRHSLGLNLKRIAIFYQNDSYGRAGLVGTEAALMRRGLTPVTMATVERNSVNVRDAVKIISAAKPDAVVMISAYKSCAAFIKAMQAEMAKGDGPTAQFYNVSFVGSQALANELGEEGPGVAISQVMPFPFDGIRPIAREYRTAMQRYLPNAPVSFTSLEGYIAARVFTEGLRRAGPNPSRGSLIAALEGMSDVDVGGFRVGFTPSNHSLSTFVDLTVIQAGLKFRN